MPNIDEAIEALLSYQQADMEGVMVLTSRQAIHEVADELKRVRSHAQDAGASEELSKLISDIEAERIGLVTWVRGGYIPLDTETLLSALRLAARTPAEGVSARDISSKLAEFFCGKQALRDQAAEAILAMFRTPHSSTDGQANG